MSTASANRESWHVDSDSRPGDQPGDTVIALQAGALATSGDARRFLLEDGIRYSHIVDPTTGWRVADAPMSVTLGADTCAEAGIICTMAMLDGTVAEAFLGAQGLKYGWRRV